MDEGGRGSREELRRLQFFGCCNVLATRTALGNRTTAVNGRNRIRPGQRNSQFTIRNSQFAIRNGGRGGKLSLTESLAHVYLSEWSEDWVG
eukprot:84131-Pyramimonas_sp.AAC.1